MKPRIKLNIRPATTVRTDVQSQDSTSVIGVGNGSETLNTSEIGTSQPTQPSQPSQPIHTSSGPEQLPKLENRKYFGIRASATGPARKPSEHQVQPSSLTSSTSTLQSSTLTTSSSTTTQASDYRTDPSRTSRERPTTTITPTFLLKGVDTIKVLHDYLNGVHPSARKLDHSGASSCNLFALTPTYGTSVNSESYTYRHKNNIQTRVVTTNHELYVRTSELIEGQLQTLKSVSSTALPVYGKCTWCRMQIEHSPVGIPTSVLYEPKVRTNPYSDSSSANDIQPNSNTQPNSTQPNSIRRTLRETFQKPVQRLINSGTLRFDVDGQFCTFECCYAGLKQLYPPYHLMRDPLYMDSEQLLRLMYSSIYPNSNSFVQPAPDWRLLKENGGPLEPKDFFSGTHTFVKTPNLVILPIKVEYMVQKSIKV